jgi:FG-GAP-like repeat
MKGVYVSLTAGDLASYRVVLDDQGREIMRERLRPGGGTVRFTADARPPAPAPAGRGAQSRRSAPSLANTEWNTIQLILDGDILRPNLSPSGEAARDRMPWWRSILAGGTTEDEGAGFGPVAIYAGGSGEVQFKNVGFKDLTRKIEPDEKVSSHFRMQRISDFYYSWCAAVADINHDGIPDIVAPPFYYLGPNFTERREFLPAHTYNVSSEYTDHMVVFAHDFTGDGWPDVVSTFTNGRPLYLYVNPRGEARRWDRYVAVPSIGSEIALLRDVDGDGMPDVVYSTREDGIAFASPDLANPTGLWKVTPVSGPLESFNPHGLGVGDINGDGRLDILSPIGWWEQPPKGSRQETWKFHPADFGGGAAEISVYDVNGDGLNDVVTPLAAHGWGISWFEQKRDANGNISFVEHPIMGDPSTKNAGGVVFSELHASIAADLDGDGIPDLIVGKRLYSHQESYTDPDPYGPAVLYWYRTVRNPQAPGGAEFVPELIHNRSGVGAHFVAVDLNHSGVPDIITSTDKGTFIFHNRMHAAAARPAPGK